MGLLTSKLIEVAEETFKAYLKEKTREKYIRERDTHNQESRIKESSLPFVGVIHKLIF